MKNYGFCELLRVPAGDKIAVAAFVNFIGLGSHFDLFGAAVGDRYLRTFLAQSFEVKLNRFPNQLDRFRARLPNRDTTRKIGNVCAEALGTFFDDDGVAHVWFQSFKPACLRILLSVPFGTSMDGCPDTVTSPGFAGCLNCR